MKRFLKTTSYIIVSFLILSPFLNASFKSFNAKKDLYTFQINVPFVNKIHNYIERFATLIDESINLAALIEAGLNPNMKYVAITEGMRKEEIAKLYQRALGWNENETEEFSQSLGCYPENEEGYLYPTVYVVPKDADPNQIKDTMKQKFEDVVATSTKNAISPIVNMDTVIRIASIIQREAGGKSDMRLISGIIWNRLFSGMKLDMDATLQYVKGDEDQWWPRVTSKDKYLESPYNTYMYKGLPPTPISNPGIAAIQAALNPQKTDCYYYLHDSKRRIHCSKTYEQHKRNVNLYLK